MTPTQLALTRAQLRLVDRLAELEARLDAGDETAWASYTEAAAALAAITPATVPGADGRLLKTSELAHAYGVSSKTILRKRARGEIAPAVQLGRRGRAALRWAAR